VRDEEAEVRLSPRRAAEAERLYVENLRRNPDDLEALYGLGCVYALTGDLRRAVELWRRCVEARPEWGEAHISLAWAYYRLGESEEGFRHVEEAYRLGVRMESQDEMLSRLLERAVKPLKRAMWERYETTRPLIPLNRQTILGLVVVLLLTLYAYSPIMDGFPKGGDAPNALSMIRYLEKNWPHFPRWCTEWGCGYPFLTFYHPLGIVSTFLLSKLLNLSIFTAYKLIMFLTILASSIGLYLFSYLIFEDDISALITAILYLLTPGSLIYLIYYGLYSEQIGYALLISSMLLLQIYVKTFRKRFLIASIISYSLLLLSHALIAALGTLILSTYIFWLHFKEKKSMTQFIKTSIILFGLGLTLTAFWYLPLISLGALRQYRISSPKSWGLLSLEQLIGLPGSGPTRLAPWSTSLALIGCIISLMKKRSRFLIIWSLIFVFYLEAGRFPIFYFLYGSVTSPHRFLPIASIFLSLLGGEAMKILKFNSSLRNSLIFFFILALSLPIAQISHMEVFRATNHRETYDLMEELSRVVDGRIAFPGYMGCFHESFNLVSKESQLSNYQLQSAPNLAWIGMADAYLFKGFGGVDEAVVVARWYGLEYLFIDEGLELAWASSSQHFKEVWRGHGYKLLRVIHSAPYASVGDRRRILIIGDRYAYENIFWTLIHAGFDPEVDVIAWIDERVDELDVEELRRFDVIILYGYSYKDRDEMASIPQQYLMEGGSILIDTGYSPDSEAPELTAPFPVSMTRAGDFFNWTFTSESEIMKDVNFTAFSPPKYGEAPWGVSYSFNLTIQPWAQTLVWLNGHPIIVAGGYGRGRVVWCGLNLPYHAKSYRNKEEAELLLTLLNWLSSPPSEVPSHSVEVERPIPEKIILSIEEEVEGDISIFIRETHFPRWRAYLKRGDELRRLEVYYSGPGFMLVIISEDVEPPVRVIFRYEAIGIDYAGYFITLCAIVLLLLMFIGYNEKEEYVDGPPF